MIEYIIYKVTHNKSGKSYIGATCQKLKTRWINHNAIAKRGSTLKLHIAIRKFGRDAFSVEKLAIVFDVGEAGILERKYIKKFNTIWPYGFNLENGGEEGFTVHKTTRAKVSKGNKGKKLSEEHKRKLVESLIGNKYSLGHKHSEKSIAKMRLAAKKVWSTAERRAKVTRVMSEKEHKMRSEAAKKYWASKVLTEEEHKRRSEAAKRCCAARREAKKLIEEVK